MPWPYRVHVFVVSGSAPQLVYEPEHTPDCTRPFVSGVREVTCPGCRFLYHVRAIATIGTGEEPPQQKKEGRRRGR